MDKKFIGIVINNGKVMMWKVLNKDYKYMLPYVKADNIEDAARFILFTASLKGYVVKKCSSVFEENTEVEVYLLNYEVVDAFSTSQFQTGLDFCVECIDFIDIASLDHSSRAKLYKYGIDEDYIKDLEKCLANL